MISNIPWHKWEMTMWRSKSDRGKNLIYRRLGLASATPILTSYSHFSQMRPCLHEVGSSSKPLNSKLFHRRPSSQMLHSLQKQKAMVYHHGELRSEQSTKIHAFMIKDEVFLQLQVQKSLVFYQIGTNGKMWFELYRFCLDFDFGREIYVRKG